MATVRAVWPTPGCWCPLAGVRGSKPASFWPKLLAEEAPREEDVPAQHPAACPASRVQAPHVDPGRASHPAGPASAWSCTAIGLIWRIRDAATFTQLSRHGRRETRGPLTAVFLPSSPGADLTWQGDRPRVGFALPRAVGSAVVRNRLRRQIRGIAAALADEDQLPAGAWLFIGRPPVAQWSAARLREAVTELVAALGAPTATSRGEV